MGLFSSVKTMLSDNLQRKKVEEEIKLLEAKRKLNNLRSLEKDKYTETAKNLQVLAYHQLNTTKESLLKLSFLTPDLIEDTYSEIILLRLLIIDNNIIIDSSSDEVAEKLYIEFHNILKHHSPNNYDGLVQAVGRRKYLYDTAFDEIDYKNGSMMIPIITLKLIGLEVNELGNENFCEFSKIILHSYFFINDTSTDIIKKL